VSVLVTASTPVIQWQPRGSEINVPLGTVNYEVVVLANSVPRPTYQWQNLTLSPLNSTDSSSSLDSDALYLIKRSYEEDQSYNIDWAPHRRVVRANNTTYAEVKINFHMLSSRYLWFAVVRHHTTNLGVSRLV
jgi:hypothetical protein